MKKTICQIRILLLREFLQHPKPCNCFLNDYFVQIWKSSVLITLCNKVPSAINPKIIFYHFEPNASLFYSLIWSSISLTFSIPLTTFIYLYKIWISDIIFFSDWKPQSSLIIQASGRRDQTQSSHVHSL